MPSLPPRDNRVLQTVDALKQEICSSRLAGALPGERELATRLRVSRITLRRAMEILESEGWVTPTSAGKRRKVIRKKIPSSEQPVKLSRETIVILSPSSLSDLPSDTRLEHTRLNSYCARAAITLLHRTLNLSHLKRPGHRLQQFVTQNPADLYLLLLSTKETQKWFSLHKIPCIVLGSTWDEFKLPSVDLDQHALGVHASSMLRRLGHQNIGILYPSPVKRGNQLFVEGFRKANPDIKLIISEQDDSPISVKNALLQLTRHNPRPSAIILPRIAYAISASGLLPSVNLALPDDVSLLCLVHDESLQYFHPPIASYRCNIDAFPRAIFNLAVKKLRHPNTLISQQALVMPEYCPADSLQRAKQ